MLMMEAVDNGEGEIVDGLGGGVQGERSGQQWDDHW